MDKVTKKQKQQEKWVNWGAMALPWLASTEFAGMASAGPEIHSVDPEWDDLTFTEGRHILRGLGMGHGIAGRHEMADLEEEEAFYRRSA